MGDLASVVLDSLGEPQDRIPLSADCVPLPLEITKTRRRREAYKQRTASMRVWSARCQCNFADRCDSNPTRRVEGAVQSSAGFDRWPGAGEAAPQRRTTGTQKPGSSALSK